MEKETMFFNFKKKECEKCSREATGFTCVWQKEFYFCDECYDKYGKYVKNYKN